MTAAEVRSGVLRIDSIELSRVPRRIVRKRLYG